jgi:hypothetical protein
MKAILPWPDKMGDQGMLVETRDAPGGALDAAAIAELIERITL